MPEKKPKDRDRTGEVFGRGCRLVERIYGYADSPALGHVYKAKHEQTGSYYAFKFSTKELNDALFRKEVITLRKLNEVKEHPHIIRLDDCCTEGTDIWISMPYIEYEPKINNVGDFVQQRGIFSVEDAVKITMQTLEALAYAHSQETFHRDVKPNNILIKKTEGGIFAVLTDFNLAKERESDIEAIVSANSSAGGSSSYSSPEQKNPSQKLPVDAKTDIYSMALTLNYMLTGFHAYDKDPRKLNKGVQDDLAELILHALEFSYKDRLGTADEFHRRLSNIKSRASKHLHSDKLIADYYAKLNGLLGVRARVLTLEEVTKIDCERDALYNSLRQQGTIIIPVTSIEKKIGEIGRAEAYKLQNTIDRLLSSIKDVGSAISAGDKEYPKKLQELQDVQKQLEPYGQLFEKWKSISRKIDFPKDNPS